MSIKSAIESASNRAIGVAGNVADYVLRNTPTSVKSAIGSVASAKTGGLIPSDALTKERNLTERAELQGSTGMTEQQRVDRYEQGYGVPALETIYNNEQQKNLITSSPGGVDNNVASSTPKQSSLPGWGTGNFAGQEVGYDGKIYKWDGSNWVAIRQDNSGGGGDNGPSFSFNEGVDKAGGTELLGQYLKDADIDGILERYRKGAYANADDLGSEIERVARENAEREYGDVMDALGVQRGEVNTLGEQQRTRAQNEKALTEEEMLANQESELKTIDKEKQGFIESDAEQKDQLGRAWRDMSLEVQRIMRGKGIADSSFATDKEVSVLKDFNAGLRELASKKSSALKDFADAVTETTSFYARKKTQLAEEVRQQVEDIDNWVRQQVQSIQAQQKTALSKKLADINDAILKAKELKTNVAQQVAQTELNFGMWLAQTEVNYKLAVAESAREKTANAGKTIAEASALSKNMFTLLENGQAQWVQNEDGTVGLQSLLDGTYLPTRTGYKDEYETLQANKADQQTLKEYTDSLVLNSLKGSVNTNKDEEENGGVMSAISNFLGK